MAQTRTLRIAHLSDLHAVGGSGKNAFGQERVVKALLEDLGEQVAAAPPDLIVFSGDLATDGTAAALARGQDLLLDPLAASFKGVPFFLVPGNHDVDLSRVDEAHHIGLERTLISREAVQERLADEEHAREARAGLISWDELVQAWNPSMETKQHGPYCSSYRLECNGLNLAVGCFDSAWRATGRPEDRGHLILGADYVRSFVDSSTDADLRIAVFHHPPEWLAGFDIGGVRAALEQARCLVLTGHNHVPNPTLQVTINGAALHSQAPCVYESPSYANGYALIDIDIDQGETTVKLRRWLPEVDRFGPEPTISGGEVLFDWPLPIAGKSTVHRKPNPTVLDPIVGLAQEQSLIGVPSSEDGPPPKLSDFVVRPRFWPVPYNEIFDRSMDPVPRPPEVDPLEEMSGKRVLIVAGAKTSGVTTSLYWLLDRHYQEVRTHLPVYIHTDASFGLRRIRQRIQQARSGAARTQEEAAALPVIAAIDDVERGQRKALGRMITLLDTDPNLVLILGTHDHSHHAIATALATAKVEASRAYLGNAGLTETKQLITRTVGAEEPDLVAKVFEFSQKLRLQRNPFNLIALASVITEEPELTGINETGLLQTFAARFLDSASASSPAGLAMDPRRWEDLLQLIAKEVVETDCCRIPSQNILRLVLDHHQARGWTESRPSDLIASLIDCRVLVEDAEGIGFRYPVMLYLFAAEATDYDPAFKNRVFSDLITYGPIIKQVAGLKRNDVDTLELVAEEAAAIRHAIVGSVGVNQFDRIEDRNGWSQAHELDKVRELVDPSPMPPSEDELAEILDERGEDEQSGSIRPFEDRACTGPTERLVAIFSLAAGVLQSSELIADTKLRARVLREVITGWSQITILHAVEEDAWPLVFSLFEDSTRMIEDPDLRQGMVEHLAMMLVIDVMATSLYTEAGSIHQQEVLSKLLDDEEFMADSAHALFATMLYAMLRFGGWPVRMQKLFDLHGKHPMIRQIVEEWSLEEYLHGEVSDKDAGQIERLLVKVKGPQRRSSSDAQQREMSKFQSKLQAHRRNERFKRESGEDAA